MVPLNKDAKFGVNWSTRFRAIREHIHIHTTHKHTRNLNFIQMNTKELYDLRMIQKTNTVCLELHTHTSR
jgi:hypothetical protein